MLYESCITIIIFLQDNVAHHIWRASINKLLPNSGHNWDSMYSSRRVIDHSHLTFRSDLRCFMGYLSILSEMNYVQSYCTTHIRNNGRNEETEDDDGIKYTYPSCYWPLLCLRQAKPQDSWVRRTWSLDSDHHRSHRIVCSNSLFAFGTMYNALSKRIRARNNLDGPTSIL